MYYYQKMAHRGEELPFPESANSFDSIQTWFENQIESATYDFGKDMYADALGIYKQYDPSDIKKKAGFELLNERLVEHGIRTGNLNIIDIALPYTSPGKRWELIADLVVERNKGSNSFDELQDSTIETYIHAAENFDLLSLDPGERKKAESDIAFQRLIARFRMHIAPNTVQDYSDHNLTLAGSIHEEFNRLTVKFMSAAQSEFPTDDYFVKLDKQIRTAKHDLAKICVQYKIDSRLVTAEYGEHYTPFTNLFVRAAFNKLSDRDRTEYIENHLSSGRHPSEFDIAYSLLAMSIVGDEQSFETFRNYLESLQRANTPLKTDYYMIKPLKWMAREVYLKLLPYLDPVLDEPQDLDDILIIDYPNAKQIALSDYQTSLIKFGPASADRTLRVGSDGNKAFWLALYCASTSQLRPGEEQNQLLNIFLENKQIVLEQISELVSNDLPRIDRDDKLFRLMSNFGYTRPNADAAIEINAYLDIISVLGNAGLSSPALMQNIVDNFQRQYSLLTLRHSQSDKLHEINRKIDQILDDNFDEGGPTRVSVLGLDILKNLKFRAMGKAKETKTIKSPYL